MVDRLQCARASGNGPGRLIPDLKFPVPVNWAAIYCLFLIAENFALTCWNNEGNRYGNDAKGGFSANFPVNFPVTRPTAPETGSLMTASTANLSIR